MVQANIKTYLNKERFRVNMNAAIQRSTNQNCLKKFEEEKVSIKTKTKTLMEQRKLMKENTDINY